MVVSSIYEVLKTLLSYSRCGHCACILQQLSKVQPSWGQSFQTKVYGHYWNKHDLLWYTSVFGPDSSVDCVHQSECGCCISWCQYILSGRIQYSVYPIQEGRSLVSFTDRSRCWCVGRKTVHTPHPSNFPMRYMVRTPCWPCDGPLMHSPARPHDSSHLHSKVTIWLQHCIKTSKLVIKVLQFTNVQSPVNQSLYQGAFYLGYDRPWPFC